MTGWGGSDDHESKGSVALAIDRGDEQWSVVKALAEGMLAGLEVPFSSELVCELNQSATAGLIDNPGRFRAGPAPIAGSRHTPPPADDVPALVEDMITQINAPGWSSPFEVAAFALWRLNWIHPFEDGNGRTARALTHLVLVHRTGADSRWFEHFPQRVRAYYHALEAADEGWKRKKLRLQNLATFLEALHAREQIVIPNPTE